MIDLIGFFINRITDLAIGLLLGIFIGIIVSIISYLALESEEKRNSSIIAGLGTAIVIGILIAVLRFIAEMGTASYVEMINSMLGLIVLLMLGLFIMLFVAYANSLGLFLGFGRKIKSRRPDKGVYGQIFSLLCFGGIALFFGFIFLAFIFEDIGFISLFMAPIIFIAIAILLIIAIRNKNFKYSIVQMIKKGKPIVLFGFVIFASLIVITGYNAFFYANFNAPVNQAQYFNSFIHTSSDDIFINEIQDNQIRLVDSELAQAIVDRHASLFGSNVKAKSLHITTYQGRLVWVAAMGPDNIFNQELNGLLIIDANDPTLTPQKIEFSSGQATVSENLFYGAETQRVAWLRNSMASYGRAYITWNPEDQLVQIQTFNNPQLFQWVSYYGGVEVLDLKGNLLETYTDLTSMPSWISQPFDETWLENNINNWGHLRQGTGFNIFAPGFLGLLTPSTDRLEISRDTRYIISPDTNQTIAVTPVHPSTNQLSNAGLFISTSNSITYYDYHQRGYVSSESIEQYVEAQEPQVAQGSYYATLPMLYKINISSSEARMAWFTPVYHQTANVDSDGNIYSYNVQFRGLYVLDAKKQEAYGRAYLSDYANTASMVAAAKDAYKQAVLNAGIIGSNQTQQSTDLIGVNITDKASYVANGTTYIAFKTNNTEYGILLASPNYLSTKDWLYALFDVQIGSIVKISGYKVNDVWLLTTITSP